MSGFYSHTILDLDPPPLRSGRYPGDMFVHPDSYDFHAPSVDGSCSCACQTCGSDGFLHRWERRDGVPERLCPDEWNRRYGMAMPVPTAAQRGALLAAGIVEREPGVWVKVGSTYGAYTASELAHAIERMEAQR